MNERSSSQAEANLLLMMRQEWLLALCALTALGFFVWGEAIFAGMGNPFLLAAIFIGLFLIVLFSALAVVRHAESLAERLGEPYGTLILTLAVTSIEIVGMLAVMTHGEQNPTLVRDTLFSVVMIILNGMVGLSLLVGGWRHMEQHFNLQGANAYLGVLLPLATLALVLPTFTVTTEGATFSLHQQVMLGIVSFGLYGTFLFIQMGRHRDYFANGREHEDATEAHQHAHSVLVEALMLLAYMVPVVFLVHQLARPIDHVIEMLDAPVALGGLAMALLVAAPEGIGAARSAFANNVQRAINIFLGSALSTIALTVPVMLAIGQLIGHPVVLGLEGAELVMLVLTLAVSIITFASGRTNVLQGAVHLLLFICFVLLIFES